MLATPSPEERRKRLKNKILDGDKQIAISTMNIVLHKYIIDDYKKSYLKKEEYLLKNEKFLNEVKAARQRLRIDDRKIVPLKWVEWYKYGNVKGGEPDNLKFKKFRDSYDNEVLKILKNTNLDVMWKYYVHDFMIEMQKPTKPFFIGNRTLKVTDLDIDGSITIKLSPGVRRADYDKAWRIFVKQLGTGEKIEKPYTSSDRMKIYLDKESGMTYKEIALKYYPNNPIESIDKLKKIVSRERKRRLGDI